MYSPMRHLRTSALAGHLAVPRRQSLVRTQPGAGRVVTHPPPPDGRATSSPSCRFRRSHATISNQRQTQTASTSAHFLLHYIITQLSSHLSLTIHIDPPHQLIKLSHHHHQLRHPWRPRPPPPPIPRRTSLPEGATADHPVANPFGAGAPELEEVEFAPTMVVVGGRDLLHDRAVDYAKRLKEMGKPVEVRDFEGQQHGFFTIDPWSDAADELMRVIKRFVDSDGRFD